MVLFIFRITDSGWTCEALIISESPMAMVIDADSGNGKVNFIVAGPGNVVRTVYEAACPPASLTNAAGTIASITVGIRVVYHVAGSPIVIAAEPVVRRILPGVTCPLAILANTADTIAAITVNHGIRVIHYGTVNPIILEVIVYIASSGKTLGTFAPVFVDIYILGVTAAALGKTEVIIPHGDGNELFRSCDSQRRWF